MATTDTKIFVDCAAPADVRQYVGHRLVRGLTTNPLLIKAAGIDDYREYARFLADVAPDLPVSLAVPARDPDQIRAEAFEIATWHPMAYVKIPVLAPDGRSMTSVISDLTSAGIRVNVTAMFTSQQVSAVLDSSTPDVPIILSVFAGRIADTGRDPVAAVRSAVDLAADHPHAEVLWASSREIYNLAQARQAGCHIITLTPSLIDRLSRTGADLDWLTCTTVEEFCEAAEAIAMRVTGERSYVG